MSGHDNESRNNIQAIYSSTGKSQLSYSILTETDISQSDILQYILNIQLNTIGTSACTEILAPDDRLHNNHKTPYACACQIFPEKDLRPNSLAL